MSYWQGVLLGLVQGLTEFLPVSSDGHLAVVEAVAGVHTPGVFLEVALHVATLGSVLVVYGRRFAAITVGTLRGEAADRRYAGLLVIATIPGVVIGVLAHDLVGRAFDSLLVAGLGFVFTGTLLWSSRRRGGDGAVPPPAGAVAIGFAQALAILPGVSRSGSTVSVGLWLGLSPVRAAEFSFLMAIPIIAGAALFEARHGLEGLAAVGAGPLAMSFAVAFVSGILAIRLLLLLLARGRFFAFAPYCWTIGAATILYALWRA